MFNVSNVLFHMLYADGTCIYISGSNINVLFDLLNIKLASCNLFLPTSSPLQLTKHFTRNVQESYQKSKPVS